MSRGFSQLAVVATAAVACALLNGCMARPTVVDSRPLWPFEELSIQLPHSGTTIAYASRPDTEAQRFVIVVQTPPCTSPGTSDAARASLGTAGLLWSEFKNDAAFLQFERPGARTKAAGDDRIDCRLRRSETATDHWRRLVIDVTAAVRAKEGLADVASVYIGVEEGALAAIGAAVRDTQASALVLVNAVIEWHSAEPLLQRLASRLPVAILHAEGEDGVPLATRELFDELRARQHPASLLTFEGVGHDFGLTTTESECFERAVALLGQQVRDPGVAMSSSQPTVVDCKKSPEVAPTEEEAITIDRVERL